MKKIYSLFAFVAFSSLAIAQTPIVSWNFDAENTSPNTGSGTITLIGGTTSSYAGGNPAAGKALNISTFPVQGTSSATAGLEVSLSTTGKSNIGFSFDTRGSNTASKWYEYFFSVDNGITWTSIANNNGAQTTTFANAGATLPQSANNLATLKIKIVSVFAPGTSDYAAIGATSSYGEGGTFRVDNLVINENQTASVKENNIAGLAVYPNPANTIVNISSDLNGVKNVEIFDILGKQVVKASTELSLNVSTLKTGVYMMKITQDGKTATRKLVIK